MAIIHPTAIVDKEVILQKSVEIGPYAVIEKGVRLGPKVKVSSYARITGDTAIGESTVIGTGALIGEIPQIVGMKENKGKTIIGKNNIIREYVTIHSSSSPDKVTMIGDNNFFMGFSHIAHDCHIHNNVVLCNGTLLAGHVEIFDYAFISAYVAVHQFVRIGRIAIIGGLSRVKQDVPPFMMMVGDSKVWGLNIVGLKRREFSLGQIGEIKRAFNVLYRQKLARGNAVRELKKTDSNLMIEIADFIESSSRGICGPQKNSFWGKLFLDYPCLIFLKPNFFLPKPKFAVK